jgi:hypothetical protein
MPPDPFANPLHQRLQFRSRRRAQLVNVRDRLRRHLLLGIELDHRVQDYFTEPAIAALDLAQHAKRAVHVADHFDVHAERNMQPGEHVGT